MGTCIRWSSSMTRKRPGRAGRGCVGAILDLCIEYGGSITGEHGVGMDKARYMPKMFSEADLDTMQLVRCAFDPIGLSNPGRSSRHLGFAASGPAGAKAPIPRSNPGWRTCFRWMALRGNPSQVSAGRPALRSMAHAVACTKQLLPTKSTRYSRSSSLGPPLGIEEVSQVLRASDAHALSVVVRGRGARK